MTRLCIPPSPLTLPTSLYVFSSAVALCSSVLNGQYTESSGTQTGSSPSATSSVSPGSSPPSRSPGSPNSSTSLSTGTIVGIAIGAAAAGGATLCATLWFCLRKSKPPDAPHGDTPTTAAAVLPRPHLDGKSTAFTASTHTPTAAGVSPYPSTMPSPSPVSQASPPVCPAMTELPGAWQQHQHQHRHPQQPQNLPPGAYPPMPQQGGYAPPLGQQQGYHEVHGQGPRPEMYVETQTRQELYGQMYGSGVYEMPSERRR